MPLMSRFGASCGHGGGGRGESGGGVITSAEEGEDDGGVVDGVFSRRNHVYTPTDASITRTKTATTPISIRTRNENFFIEIAVTRLAVVIECENKYDQPPTFQPYIRLLHHQ